MSSASGIVVAAHPQAAEAGALMLAAGGNAVDAAVATAFALTVVEPEASGLGGGGFLVYYDATADQYVSLDYRELAPHSSTEGMFSLNGPGMPGLWDRPEDEAQRVALQRHGGPAVAVPRMVRGLFDVHAAYGLLPLAEVLAPAIRLAEEGFEVSNTLYGAVLNVYDVLIGNEAMAEAFLNDGLPYEPGETARRPDLAITLRFLLEFGASAFYTGDLAQDIVHAVQAAGGMMDAGDLAAVEVAVASPMVTTYRGIDFVAPPLPSGGLAVFETLSILQRFDVSSIGPQSPEAVHLIAEATKRVFADRAAYVGDPRFVEVPVNVLLSSGWAEARAASIDPNRAVRSPLAGSMESSSTTHVSVVDASGHAVSLTQSIGSFFGSRVFVPQWGILLNNTMADFDPEPGSPNSIAPGKAPLSSMCPLVARDETGLRAVLGTPGGTRITSTLVQLIVQLVDWNMSLNEAIETPRFHAESDTLDVESRFPDAVLSALEARGHSLSVRSAFDLYFGGAHLIEVCRNGNDVMLVGTADPRRAGQAAGVQ